MAANRQTLIDKLNEIGESVAVLQASFDAHLKQDEELYRKIADMANNQVQMVEKLSEYNTQLQIHIAGVSELRKQTAIIEQGHAVFVAESNARLSRIEKPFIWLDYTVKFCKAVGIVAATVSACYGLFSFLSKMLH